MIKVFRKMLTIAMASGLFLAPVLAPAMASAAVFTGSNTIACGANGDLGETSCDATDNTAVTKVQNLLTIGINIFSVVVGLVCVVMIIVGGLKYVTSQGDSGNVSGAKNTILYAIVGLVIVALAQLIVKFVVNKASVAGG